MVLFSYLDLLILLEGTVNNWQNGTTTYGISGYPLYSITLAARQAAGSQKKWFHRQLSIHVLDIFGYDLWGYWASS